GPGRPRRTSAPTGAAGLACSALRLAPPQARYPGGAGPPPPRPTGPPRDPGAEGQQVGQAEPARLGGGQGGTPAGVDDPVALAVGVDDADQDLADQLAADRAQVLAPPAGPRPLEEG